MAIINSEDRFKEYERSIELSSPLSRSLPEAELRHQQIINKIKTEKELAVISKETRIESELNKNEIHSLDLDSEKGESIWLNAMSLKGYHFDLTKSKFRDGRDPV